MERLRRRLRLAMIRDALAREDVRKARALAAELAAPPPPELAARLEATERRVAARSRRLAELEKDADLLRGNRLRVRGTSIVALLLAIRHLVALLHHPGPGHDLDPSGLLLGMSAISALVLPALALSRQRLMRTRPDRAFLRLLATYCVMTPLLIHVGMRFGMGLPAILTLITLVSSALLLAVEVPFPGVPFGLAGLAAGLLASAFPDAARYLFMGWTMATVLGMVVDLVQEGRRERARHAAATRTPAAGASHSARCVELGFHRRPVGLGASATLLSATQ